MTYYIYEQSYSRWDLARALGYEPQEAAYDQLLKTYMEVNNGRGGSESLGLFEVRYKRVTPQFVGVLYTQDSRRIVCLPKYQAPKSLNGTVLPEDAKRKNQTRQLLEVFRHFRKELSIRDILFENSLEFYNTTRVAEELRADYEENGPYTRSYAKVQNKKGRISWSDTVKRILPVMVDGTPLYTEFAYRATYQRETEITRIEKSIMRLGLPKGKLPFDDDEPLYEEHEFVERWEYFLGMVNGEMSAVFDDVRMHRLELLKDFLESLVWVKKPAMVPEEEDPSANLRGVYAIANYDYVFEVLLTRYFSDDRGIEYHDGKAALRSSLWQEADGGFGMIPDMNAPEYRPYLYHMNDEMLYGDINDHTKNNGRNTNYIDVTYDDERTKEDGSTERYCVILDAKNYGGEDRLTDGGWRWVPSLPTSESVFKQYFYVDIMRRIYRANTEVEEEIRYRNAFVLPVHTGKGEIGETLFSLVGSIETPERAGEPEVRIIRADMDRLTQECLQERGTPALYRRRREDFLKLFA